MNETTQTLFLVLCVAIPFGAVIAGILGRIRWLWFALIVNTTTLVSTLWSLYVLVENGQYPGATGMEGIAFFVFPAIYLGSTAVSLLAYVIARRFSG